MEKPKLSHLEDLLKLKGSADPSAMTSDTSVLSCGCLVSESFFKGLQNPICIECGTKTSLLKEVKPLREMYFLISQLQSETGVRQRRRSSSKKSFRVDSESSKSESLDLISLFYKFAKEELTKPDNSSVPTPITTSMISSSTVSTAPKAIPIEIFQKHDSSQSQINSTSISPLHKTPPIESLSLERNRVKPTNYEVNALYSLSEEQEYNFSKCFPFHRKVTTFATQQGKLFSANRFKSGVIKKASRFICSAIHTQLDVNTGQEITRFVLITEKRWELYQLNPADLRPNLVCCGKMSGEYGSSYSSLREDNGNEVVIRNDFSKTKEDSGTQDELKKKLQSWELLSCQLGNDYLVLSGTKGIMRVLNVSLTSLPHELGKPVYTFVTNFPIRCIAVSPTDPVVACSIMAKERLSGKEQPFVIVHKLVRSTSGKRIIGSVEPITITIPYRDPIKIISFNPTATHIVCCTVWESRYLIIKLRNLGSDDFRKPRLIWTDSKALRTSKRKKQPEGIFYDDSSDDNSDGDDALMMDREGITDVQFGAIPNTVVLTSCSLQNRPPIMLKLEGSSIDPQVRALSDSLSQDSSLYSRHEADEDNEISNIKSTDLLYRFHEVGFSIYKAAMSPRRDALVFLDKEGRIFLVSIPNYDLNSNSGKKVVVLLGEVSNAERYTESASIKFSADGGKVFASDRKGNFSVFDFTKGIPGQDSDVVKCKIINV